MKIPAVRNKLAIGIVFALLLLIVSGCVLPIVPGKTSLTYEFKADASMKYTQVIEGTLLADTSEWEGDCTAKYRSALDNITTMLTMATAAGMTKGQAADENVQKITALLNNIKNNTVCHFSELPAAEAAGVSFPYL